MTNTINSVPRELLEVIEQTWRIHYKGGPVTTDIAADAIEKGLGQLRALLSVPSPAGVDGLEVVGWYRMDDRKAITPYPSVCATWHKMGVKVGAAYSDSAHVIIDGLRGENEALHAQVKVLQSDANSWQSGYDEGRRMGGKHCALTIDQQARRICELEAELARITGLWELELGRAQKAEAGLFSAALSAGKEGE